MSVASMFFLSKALGRPLNYNVYLPDGEGATGGPYPVLYLLHGMSGDQHDWSLWTNLDLYVRPLPLVVIMPSGENSFYSNTVYGDRFEDAMIQDLMKHVEGSYNVLTGPKNTAMDGLSMGGFGAIKNGLKFPDKFGSVAGHSSAVGYAHELMEGDASAIQLKIFGKPSKIWAENDPFTLVGSIPANKMPALYFDCGTEDFLIEENREFHTHLENLKIKHVYNEFPGAHTWEFWNEHIKDSLAHHCRALGIKPVTPEGVKK